MKRFVYFARFEPGYIKVGHSNQPERRIKYFQRSSYRTPSEADLSSGVLLATIPGSPKDERNVQKILNPHAVSGTREWFHDNFDVRTAVSEFSRQLPKRQRTTRTFFVAAGLSQGQHAQLKSICLDRGIAIQDYVRELVVRALQK